MKVVKRVLQSMTIKCWQNCRHTNLVGKLKLIFRFTLFHSRVSSSHTNPFTYKRYVSWTLSGEIFEFFEMIFFYHKVLATKKAALNSNQIDGINVYKRMKKKRGNNHTCTRCVCVYKQCSQYKLVLQARVVLIFGFPPTSYSYSLYIWSTFSAIPVWPSLRSNLSWRPK